MKIRIIVLSCFFVFYFEEGNLSPLPSEQREDQKPPSHPAETQPNFPQEQNSNCESGNCHKSRQHESSNQNNGRSTCRTCSKMRENRTTTTTSTTCEGEQCRTNIHEISETRRSTKTEGGECQNCSKKKEIRSRQVSCESGNCQTVRRQGSSDSGGSENNDSKCTNCSKTRETKLQQEYSDGDCTECANNKTSKSLKTEFSPMSQKQDGEEENLKHLKEFHQVNRRNRGNQRKIQQCNGECSRKRAIQEPPCVGGNCPTRKKEQTPSGDVENIHKKEEKVTCEVKEVQHCTGENCRKGGPPRRGGSRQSHKHEESTCSTCNRAKKEHHCVGNCPNQTAHTQTCTGGQCGIRRQKCEGDMCRNEESNNTKKQNDSRLRPGVRPRRPTSVSNVPPGQNCESGNCQMIVKKDLSCTDSQQIDKENKTVEQTFSNAETNQQITETNTSKSYEVISETNTDEKQTTTEIHKQSCDGDCTKSETKEERRTERTQFTQQICKGNCSQVNQSEAVISNDKTLEKKSQTKSVSTKTDQSTQMKASGQPCNGNCTLQLSEDDIHETCTECENKPPTVATAVCENCEEIDKLMTVTGEDEEEETPPAEGATGISTQEKTQDHEY